MQRKYVVCNELPGSMVGWVIVRNTVSFGVWEFESGRFFSFLSKFLFLVSFFRIRLSIRVSVRIGFDPSSPIVHELVLSLT